MVALLFRLSLLLALSSTATASYAFYVGKDLTFSGRTLVGGTGEEVSSHWLQLFPAQDHPPNATIRVGVTESAVIPGELISIPQVAHTYRYLSVEYTDYEGFPAPLTNGGLNEKGVAVRDVWAPSRDELVEMTSTPQRGVNYANLARIVLERADTARHGVEIIGSLIRQHGYATYGGNTHLLADANEGWVVWELAGGRGLLAAERLGPDQVRVLYPGYIEDFPPDFRGRGDADFMGSDNIVTFAVEQGWWDPKSGQAFNIFRVYGKQGPQYKARDGGFKFMSQAALEEATQQMAPVSEADLMARVRDHRISDDQAGYGQIVSIPDSDRDPDLLMMWNAPTGSVTAPFLPWWLGVDSVPPEFSQHRYLTDGASSSFLNPDFEFQEASDFAGRLFKRVLYYMCSDPDTFHPLVTRMLIRFENASLEDVDWVEKGAAALIARGERTAARRLLTHYAHSRASEALRLGHVMADALDGWIKLDGRWKTPVGIEINDAGLGAETVNCLQGWNPDLPQDRQRRKPHEPDTNRQEL